MNSKRVLFFLFYPFILGGMVQPNIESDQVIKVEIEGEDLEIPLEIALVSKTISNLHVEGFQDEVIPLESIDRKSWDVVAPLLSVVRDMQENDSAAFERLVELLRELSIDDLISCVSTANYLEITALFDIALSKACHADHLLALSWEKLETLPPHLRNKLIFFAGVSVFGPYPSRLIAQCIGHTGQISSIAILPDGGIVSGSYDGTMRIWAADGKQLALCQHAGLVSKIMVLSNGLIVSSSLDNNLYVWSADGRYLATCQGHEKQLCYLAELPDDTIVSAAYDGTVRIWTIQGRQKALCQHEGLVSSIAITSTGEIVTGSSQGIISIWRADGELLRCWEAHEKSVEDIAITFDNRIVSCSADTTIRIWDMRGNQVGLGKAHKGTVQAITITPDGKIVSISIDHIAHIWDLKGQHLGEFEVHVKDTFPAIKLRDGKIIFGTKNSYARVWDTSGLRLATCQNSRHTSAIAATYRGIVALGSKDNSISIWDTSLPLSESASREVWKHIQNAKQQESKSVSGWEEVNNYLSEVLGNDSVSH